MYKDEIAEYLRSKAVREVAIPNHPAVDAVEQALGKKEWERACLLLNQIFRQHRFATERARVICGVSYGAYEVPIFSSVRSSLIGNTYGDRVMDALFAAGVITLRRQAWFSLKNREFRPAVYAVNKDVWQAEERVVALTTATAISVWTQWLTQRQKPFSRVDRDVINRHHKRLRYAITGAEYARRHRKEAEAAARATAAREGKAFDRRAWRTGFICACRNIDGWNALPDREKWILCRVDAFGQRLHHGLTNAPTSLRQYARLGDLVPLYEIDLTASQPTLTAINMVRDGVADTKFVEDINDGCLYERYAIARGNGWSRSEAKQMFFRALFGRSDSPEIKHLASVYPVLADYLRQIKSEPRPRLEKEIENWAPHKNNCVDVQRAESAWARSVWRDLLKAGIKFLPIHDSVIVFGHSDAAGGWEADQQAAEIVETMGNHLAVEGITPRFRCTRFCDSEDSEN